MSTTKLRVDKASFDRKSTQKMLPVIDHMKQREKLKSIIGLCEDNTAPDFKEPKPLGQSHRNSVNMNDAGRRSQALPSGLSSTKNAARKSSNLPPEQNANNLVKQRRRIASQPGLREK